MSLTPCVTYVSTIEELQEIPITNIFDGQVIEVLTTRRSGRFVVKEGGYSEEVGKDNQKGIWVPFADDPNGATVIAYRQHGLEVKLDWFKTDTNSSSAFENACTYATANNLSVMVSPEDTYLESITRFNIPPNKTLRLRGTGGRLVLSNNASISSTEKLATTLAVDAPRKAVSIEIADATGVKVGDLLHIDTDTPVESGWGYHKNCIRKVAGVSGNTILLDQLLDFFFTVAEATTVNFFHPAYVDFDGVGFLAVSGRALGLRFLSGGRIANGLIEGPVEGWKPGFSDGIKTVGCDRIIYDRFDFLKLRYPPQITVGSRFTQVRNCIATHIRHLDANTWAQDTLYENITGVSTDGIIQSHPSIRTLFRNVHDSLTGSGLHGFDLRGLGEVVEDCSSHATAGIGANTCRPLLNPDYVSMGQEHTRRVTRFRSPTAVLSCGHHGNFIVEDCDVPVVSVDGSSHTLGAITVDETTRAKASISRVEHRQKREIVDVTALDGYVYVGPSMAITSVTSANPGIVMVAGHGLSEGTVIRLTNMEGMDELDHEYFMVGAVTTDTFELEDLAGVPVDTSGYTPYVSGGHVRAQKPAKVFALGDNPHVGRYPKAHYRIRGLGGGSAITVAITTENGLLRQKDRWGFIKVRTRGGFTEKTFAYSFIVYSGSISSVTPVPERSLPFGPGVSITNVASHFHTEVSEEGGNIIRNSHESYWFFDVVAENVEDIEVEIEEWIDADLEDKVFK